MVKEKDEEILKLKNELLAMEVNSLKNHLESQASVNSEESNSHQLRKIQTEMSLNTKTEATIEKQPGVRRKSTAI